jgi:DegV family protein with EDD domain
MTRTEFYSQLPYFPEHPTTAAPSIDQFAAAYNRLAEEGATEIVSIHISEVLSATANAARQAAETIDGVKIAVRDSGNVSMALGFQVEEAAKLAQEGKSLEEIENALDDLAPRTFVTAQLDTLEFLRRSGRMSGLMKGLGSILSIKPILTMERGTPGSIRVRTASKAQARIKELLEERLPIERFALVHSNALEKAQAFKKSVEHLIPAGIQYARDITPVLGVHLGPNLIGYAIQRAKSG